MSKISLKKNYTLLALAIVYVIVATIQIFAPGILAIQLYFSVAFISLSTTLCETIKSYINLIRAAENTALSIASEGKEIIRKDIEAIKQYPISSVLKEHLQMEYDDLSKRLESKRGTRWGKRLKFFDSTIQFVEIFDILLFAIITPLKIIPNGLLTNKVIDVMSLLSVAFAFLSIYMNENITNSLDYYKEQSNTYCQISEFFLGIINTISENPLPQESEESRNDNNRKTL